MDEPNEKKTNDSFPQDVASLIRIALISKVGGTFMDNDMWSYSSYPKECTNSVMEKDNFNLMLNTFNMAAESPLLKELMKEAVRDLVKKYFQIFVRKTLELGSKYR